MATQKSPLLGYNHNLKYKGRVYHVQTEDSGLDNPHIFTHLFHDGTILSTARQEYQDLVGDPDWESQLRGRMQAQHKDMMKGLIKGACDDRILEFFGVLEAEVEEEIPMATLPPPPKRERPAAETPPPVVPPAPAAPAVAPWNPAAARAAPGPQPAQAAPAPPMARPPAPSSSGGVVVAMPMVIVGNQVPPAARPPAPSAMAPRPAAPSTTTPVAQFRPEESRTVPDSIFGSELISEKSLDEVILAYLSEDMTED
jgi:hypothetical protein